jgi:hypothetical protein
MQQLQLGYFTELDNSCAIIPQGLAILITQFHSVWWLLQAYFTGLCNFMPTFHRVLQYLWINSTLSGSYCRYISQGLAPCLGIISHGLVIAVSLFHRVLQFLWINFTLSGGYCRYISQGLAHCHGIIPLCLAITTRVFH